MAKSNPSRRDSSDGDDQWPNPGSPPPLPSKRGRVSKSGRRKTPKKARSNSGLSLWIGGGVGAAVILLAVVLIFFVRSQKETPIASAPVASPATESESSPAADRELVEVTVSDAVTPSQNDGAVKPAEETVVEAGVAAAEQIAPEESPSKPEEELATVDDAHPPTPTESASESNVPDEPPGSDTDLTASSGEPVPDEQVRVINEASLLMQQKKYKQAVAALNRASFRYKTEIRPDFYLGLIYSGVGANEPETAEKYYKRALERAPTHVATLNNLALIQIKNKKFRAAWTCFSKSIKGQENPVFDQNLGRLLNQSEILGLKKDDLKIMKELQADLSKYNNRRGWFYLPLDDTPASQTEFVEFCRDGDLEDRSCSHCLGHGAVLCRNCGGKRNVLITGTSTQVFRSDIDPRPIVTTAPTNALVNCSGCGGSGRIRCSNCRDGTDPNLDIGRGRGR